MESTTPGSTATFSFTGTSVRWIGARGRDGVARVSIDGGAPKTVELRTGTSEEFHTPVITLYDLSDGPHTLTIEVVSGVVVVDAFEVQPTTTWSRWQDTDPNVTFTAGWTKSSTAEPWSGNGDTNVPELPITAYETPAAGETATLNFRGTEIHWVGYRGPDGGIAQVRIDGGPIVEVDTYSPQVRFQQTVFKATGLADTNHTLVITTTGLKNPAASNSRIVVDAFNVMVPGRRYEENDRLPNGQRAILFSADWFTGHNSRIWSGGVAARSNTMGDTATFHFNGTSVSWLGARKNTIAGRVNVYMDGVFVREVRLDGVRYPKEGYQMTVFRMDGLAPGPHTLMLEVTSRTGGSNVIVDAFDVHP